MKFKFIYLVQKIYFMFLYSIKLFIMEFFIVYGANPLTVKKFNDSI